MSADFAAEPTRVKLRAQLARLDHAAATGFPEQRTMAARLAGDMRAYLRSLATAPAGWTHVAGMIGPNGGSLSTYAVDDACRHAERDPLAFTRRHPSGFIMDNEEMAA